MGEDDEGGENDEQGDSNDRVCVLLIHGVGTVHVDRAR